MNTADAGGSTPVDPDEARALIPSHIASRRDLNEWEHDNIVEGERWAFARRHQDPLSADFIRRLHRRMFGATWRWAGEWRTTEKNIGIAPERISEVVHALHQDLVAQVDAHSYPIREIAARLHHRLAQIHPFQNGNGRLARTLADVFLVANGEPRFTWGDSDLVVAGTARERYIAALRSADARDYRLLFEFLDIR